MPSVRLLDVLLFCIALGTATIAAAQPNPVSQPKLEVLTRQGDYYWVVETAPDGSRRGGWVSVQTPLDHIDRTALQPIPAVGAVQPAPAPIAAATPLNAAPTPLQSRMPTDQPTRSTYPPVRKGFWFNVGAGPAWGQCGICIGRQVGVALDLSGGGTINPHVLLGGGTTSWYRQYSGVTGVTGVSAGTADLRWRVYPSKTSGFFVTSGLGLGIVSVNNLTSGLSVKATGLGGVVGVGWDVRVGRKISLTPFYNGFWLTPKQLGTLNLGWITSDQFGLGVTFHWPRVY